MAGLAAYCGVTEKPTQAAQASELLLFATSLACALLPCFATGAKQQSLRDLLLAKGKADTAGSEQSLKTFIMSCLRYLLFEAPLNWPSEEGFESLLAAQWSLLAQKAHLSGLCSWTTSSLLGKEAERFD